MKGNKEFWEAQLKGLKRLPDASGAWGVLLPRPGSKQKLHEADAAEFIEEMNSARLRFDTRDVFDMNRGYFLGIGAFMFGFMGLSTVVFVLRDLFVRASSVPLFDTILIYTVLLACVAGSVVVAYRSARAPFVEPIVLCRSSRRFYAWAGKKEGWKFWSYDDLVPFTMVGKLVTGAGASTAYMLRLGVIDPQTREIKESIAPAPMQRSPQACGQTWQFIREYMDGKPEDLPAVRHRPSVHDKVADLARFDRRFGAAIITPDHRIEAGIFPKFFYWFWAVVDYWQMRAMAWIQRTAPRPDPPAELGQALGWCGENPYRFVEQSGDERLAVQGKLPRLRLRWAVAGALATVLWGGLFLMMCYGILSTLWER